MHKKLQHSGDIVVTLFIRYVIFVSIRIFSIRIYILKFVLHFIAYHIFLVYFESSLMCEFSVA